MSLSDFAHVPPSLGDAIRVYHPGTADHSVRVANIARAIAVELGLSDLDVEAVQWAGLLHDLGKLAVPQHILDKLGPLTDPEWTEVRRHPSVGSEILNSLSTDLRPVAAAVRAHHERWDGGGYPDGLAGEEIPLAGRIVAVADVYDALTHRRRYRPHVFASDAAMTHLVDRAGSHFDDSVVRAFRRAHASRHARTL